MYPSYQIKEKYYPVYIFVVAFGQSDKIIHFGNFDRNRFIRRFVFDDSPSWNVLLVCRMRGSFEIFIVQRGPVLCSPDRGGSLEFYDRFQTEMRSPPHSPAGKKMISPKVFSTTRKR